MSTLGSLCNVRVTLKVIVNVTPQVTFKVTINVSFPATVNDSVNVYLMTVYRAAI